MLFLFLIIMFFYFVQQELFKYTLIRELEHIGGDKELVVHASKGVFHHLLVFAGAEQYTDGRVVTIALLLSENSSDGVGRIEEQPISQLSKVVVSDSGVDSV